MKYVEEFRDRKLVASLAVELDRIVDRPLRVMEVCGTHTNAIFSHGLRSLLPEKLQLISGPGCPVCVTPTRHIDGFIQVARMEKVTVATFGDLVRVPGSQDSLAKARAEGARIEVVYSPMDGLKIAQNEPDRVCVFLAVGFETTAPVIGATVLQAARMGVTNFCIYPANKIMPPPLDALMSDPELNIDGLLCPGHVSAIIGTGAYQFLADKYGLACVVSGFEPVDILQALIMLARQVKSGVVRAENAYARVVKWEGNTKAQALIDEIFEVEDTSWRGLGVIEKSGLGIRDKFAEFDAVRRFDVMVADAPEPRGCRCGDILKGHCLPPDCPLFGKRCTSLNPVGPCMVSTEGTCAAYYRFGINT
jgi:hydrogenase expression/formation protein HypD